MIRKHDIKPLESFYLDCEFNNIASILLSIEPLLITELRENCYRYHVETREAKSGVLFNRIVIDFKYSLMNNRLKFMNSVYYNDKDDLVGKLKKVIDSSMYALAMVDLYDYIPRSICYHKFHWYHFTLIVGYDDKKDTFFVLDDDYHGYREFEVPSDKLFQAIKCSNRNDAVFYMDFCETMFPQRLSCSRLRRNARRIIKDIKKLKRKKYYLMSNIDYKIEFDRTLTIIMFEKIRNRHIINVQLFQELIESKMIYEEDGDVLITYAKDITNEWKMLNKVFYTAYEKDYLSNMCEVNDSLIKALEKERRMWKLFLRSCKRVNKFRQKRRGK